MSTHPLDVQVRTVLGKKVKLLRQKGLLPATVYGKGISPISIQLDERSFNSTYRQVGRSALVELNIPSVAMQSAFVHAVQRHPVSRLIIHVDFRVVDLKVAITVAVPLVFIGTSPLVEREDAVVNQVLAAVEVHALPAELPQSIEVDISVLDEMDKTIHVRDLATSGTYTIVTDGDELIIALSQSRVEEEEEAIVAETAAAEPELIREDRGEDDAE